MIYQKNLGLCNKEDLYVFLYMTCSVLQQTYESQVVAGNSWRGHQRRVTNEDRPDDKERNYALRPMLWQFTRLLDYDALLLWQIVFLLALRYIV